jgi:hypothetical protein
MNRTLGCGVLLVMLLAACSHTKPIAPAPVASVPAAAPAPVAAPVAAKAPTAPATPPLAPSIPPLPAPGPAAASGKNPPDYPVAARQPAPPKPAAPAPKAAIVAAAPPPPPPPPALNLASLEQRLRDTHAIGVFTKLSLKNQVDDLLDQFRAFYRGQVAIPLAALRQSYDLLMLKVLSLLQDSDPPLANDIVASREAIWGILKDPAKFATIS